MSRAPRHQVFAGGQLDRAGLRRRDRAWLAEALESAQARFVCFAGLAPFCLEADGGALEAGWLSGHARAMLPVLGDPVFLGLDAEGAPHFGLALEPAADAEDGPLAGIGGAFQEMRAAAMRLSAGDTAALGAARSLLDWHARHGYCANCGTPTTPAEGGWKRICPACRAEHFPRTDPVVIMLPVAGERCVVGRQGRFPPGMWSALAGFVEPGESLEEAIARETMEEVGVRVHGARYLASQPWPFPSSLMLGFLAECEAGDLLVDRDELEDACWLSRAEVRAGLAGEGPSYFPPPVAIAHWLLQAWAAGE